MKTNEIKNKLEYAKKHYILAKLSDCFVNNNFVQLEFKALNDEPLVVSMLNEEDNVFEYNSRFNLYYVKDESLEKYLINKYGPLSDYTYDEEIDIIEEYLADKVVVIEPYYYYNDNKEIFYKNGNIIDIINTDNSDTYIEIPKLDDKNFDLFISEYPFKIENITKDIDVLPEYLFYDKTFYKTYLEYDDSFVSKTSNVVPANYENLLEINAIYETKYSIFVKRNEFFKSIEDNKDKVINDGNITKVLDDFYLYTKEDNLCYTKEDIYNFYTCIEASELVILAGMSGTGKTRLPLSFAKYFNMSEEKETLLFVPISPSYLEPSDVLGFLNPNTNTYVPSQTGIVEFLIHASLNPNKMHMIIFDEMNLSQIEYWFAPFLSLLEQDQDSRKLVLYSPASTCLNKKDYQSSIKIGNNIVFVGTVNLDETTKNISDRLKDRSFIINLNQSSFLSYQEEQKNKNKNYKKMYRKDFYNFTHRLDHTFNYIENLDSSILSFLDTVHNLLNTCDRQKGISFRTVKNISQYMYFKPNDMPSDTALDLVFKQTVMKKINGSSDFLDEILGVNDKSNSLIEILDAYSELSDFKQTRKEIEYKIKELKKYGYAQ